MVQYEWNNMLHNFVEKILVSTLESEFHDVRDKVIFLLLKQGEFISYIVVK